MNETCNTDPGVAGASQYLRGGSNPACEKLDPEVLLGQQLETDTRAINENNVGRGTLPPVMPALHPCLGTGLECQAAGLRQQRGSEEKPWRVACVEGLCLYI